MARRSRPPPRTIAPVLLVCGLLLPMVWPVDGARGGGGGTEEAAAAVAAAATSGAQQLRHPSEPRPPHAPPAPWTPTRAADNTAEATDDTDAATDTPADLLHACQSGPASAVRAILRRHPDWATARRTATGETCLHLAALADHREVLDVLLTEVEAYRRDPDPRTLGGPALREPPLAGAVKNGHAAAARRLLEAGADVNLAFDSMMGGRHPVTVLDVLALILPAKLPARPSPLLARYLEVRELLLEYGARRYADRPTADEL